MEFYVVHNQQGGWDVQTLDVDEYIALAEDRHPWMQSWSVGGELLFKTFTNCDEAVKYRDEQEAHEEWEKAYG